MKIGVVNDSPMALQAIARTLEAGGKHQVIWTARGGEEALSLCFRQLPELVLMDLVMPGLNGVETTRRIIQRCPTAILVVTASVKHNCRLAFQAMGEGALDVIATPRLCDAPGQTAFLRKIDQIATLLDSNVAENSGCLRKISEPSDQNLAKPNRLALIGCSVGGPAATAEILHKLPQTPGAAVVIVQHIDSQFIEELASWLELHSSWPVRLAKENQVLHHGTVWLADAARHLLLNEDGRACCSHEPSQLPYRPSVDVLFNSIAACWQGSVIAAILTGMGRDGASGLLALRKRGFVTLAQDRSSSAIFGMPKAAVDCGAASETLPLQQIAERIAKWIEKGK